MGKSVEDIMTFYSRQRQDNVGRNRDFAYLHGVYHGWFFDSRNRDIMDGQGRVMLRDNRREDRAQPLVANLLKGIVDDYVSLVGIMPDVKVPAPDGDQDFADMMEKYHYGVWEASNMVIQLKCMGWWHSVMGGCAALIWPNFQKRHAEIRFVGPDKVYGVPDLINPFEFSSAVVVEYYSMETIKDYFPQKGVQEWAHGLERMNAAAMGTGAPYKPGMVEVVRYFDKEEVVTVMAREVTTIKGRPTGQHEGLIEMGRAKHELGHCLVVPFQNILVPGEVRGVSDIEESVGLNQYANFLLNANEEYVKQELFSPLILIDPQKAPEDIDLESPTAIIPINAGGDAHRLVTSTSGQQVMSAEMARAQQLIEYVAGTPQVRTEGRLKSSISTGRAMEKSQGPHMGRIEYRNDLNAFRLQHCNSLSVMLTYKEFADDDVELFGMHQRGGGAFRVVMKGKDLQGYTFNKVTYSPSMHMGLEQRIVAVLQLRGAQPRPMVSARSGIEILGITDHPDEELRLIEEEMKHDAAFMAELQKSQQGGGGGEDPLAKQVGLESGSTPKPTSSPPSASGAGAAASPTPVGSLAAPAPDMSGAAAIGQTPPPPPPTSGLEGGTDIEGQIRKIIAPLKLNDDVYLVSADPDQIKLLARNYIDARRVSRVLRQIWGSKVSVRESSKIPADATKVSGGGGGDRAALPAQASQPPALGQ